MNTIFNTQAMFFPGFYESVLENSDYDYNETRSFIDDLHENHPKLEIDEDEDIEIDYQEYRKQIASAWARGYASYMPSFVKSCEFESIVPPRDTGYGPDYRFGTDKLYVDIEMDEDWLDKMKAFITDNKEWFEARLKDDWTSRDGFMSFMENDLGGWLKGLEDEDERYVGTTLAYMMLKEYGNFYESINMDVLDEVSFFPFISLTPEKQQELDDLAEEEERERRAREYDEKYQLKLDFPQDGQE
jgi:hypothetical protein